MLKREEKRAKRSKNDRLISMFTLTTTVRMIPASFHLVSINETKWSLGKAEIERSVEIERFYAGEERRLLQGSFEMTSHVVWRFFRLALHTLFFENSELIFSVSVRLMLFLFSHLIS